MDPAIQVWTELEGFLPLIFPRNVRKKTNNEVILDFRLCRAITSHGACLFLTRLLKANNQYNARKTLATLSSSNRELLEKIQFFEHLKLATDASPVSHDLELPLIFEERPPRSALPHRTRGSHYHFPIFRLAFAAERTPRNLADEFITHLTRQLAPFERIYSFHASQLMMILWEIARNAADHSHSDAFFGMDIEEQPDGSAVLSFAFSDLGPGLLATVTDYLQEHHRIERIPYRNLCESYNWALSLGTTTKPRNRRNHGVGMSMISQGAKQIGLDLEVFDAQSRGMVSKMDRTSIRELRQLFSDIGFAVGFAYLGSLLLQKNP